MATSIRLPGLHVPTPPKPSFSTKLHTTSTGTRLHRLPSFTGSSSFFGTSSKSSGFYGTGKFTPTKYKVPSAPTTEQVLQKLWLEKHVKPHHSFLGRLIHDAGHSVEKGLDLISRPSYAIASGVYDATKHGGFDLGQFGHGLKTGIEGKTKIGFGQVLQEHGILKGHGILRGIAGFGLDVGTDPVLLASLGTGAGEAELAAKAAEMGVSKDVLKKTLEATAKGTFKSSAEAKAAGDLLKTGGEHFAAHTKLAYAHRGILKKIEAGTIDKAFSKKALSNLHGLEGAAHMELSALGPRMLRAQYKIPFGPLLSKELPIKAPGLKRIADAQGILGHLPYLPKAAETIGKAFKPGWRAEKAHALETIARHLGSLRQQESYYLIGKHLLGPLKQDGINLSEEQMRHALKVGETARGIVRMREGRPERILQKKFLARLVQTGELTPQEAKFLEGWHNTTEAFRKAEAEYGVHYDKPLLNGAKDNVIYVPHMRIAKTNEKFTRGATVLSKRSFQFPRAEHSQMALYEHAAQHAPDIAEQLVKNPLELLIRRGRSGAIKQSETWMRDLVASTFGHPATIADQARQLKLWGQKSVLEEKMAQLHTLDPVEKQMLENHALATAEEARQASLLRAGIQHMTETAARKKEITALRGQVTKASKRSVPTAKQFVTMSRDQFARFDKAFAKHPIRKALRSARVTHRNLDAFERAIASSVKKAGDLTPITGATPHGSNYKALINELVDASRGALPAAKAEDLRASALRPMKRGESFAGRHDQLVEDALSHVHTVRAQNIAKLEEQLTKTFPAASKAGRKNLKSILTNKEKAFENHLNKWPAIEQRINERHMLRLMQAHDAINARTETELRIGERLRKAIDKKERQIENARMPNPDIPHGFVRVDSLRHVNGSPIYLPPQIAESLTRAQDALRSDEFLQEFYNVLQKNLARWKVGATVVNPGYAIRNATSILWNSYISPKGGMPLWAWSRYGPKAARILRDISKAAKKDPAEWTKADIQSMRIHNELAHHGIYMGLFGGDVERARRALEGQRTAAELTKAGHPLQGYARMMTTSNIQRENWERLTHYLYRREGQGMSRAEAADMIRMAHFDYGDLTKTEQKLRRGFVPFYTWTRRNIPYQISSMLQRPGKYAAFPLLANESEYAAGPQQKGAIVPGFVQDALGFRVPFGGKGNYYLPRLGPEDLTIPEHPIGRGTSMLSPFIQVPAELLTNKRLSTGAPIYGSATSHPRTPVSGFAADILRMIPGTDVGPTARNVGGKEVYGQGANPLVGYFAGQTPLTNLLVNSQANVKQAQRGGAGKGLLSWLGGVTTYKPDQQALQTGAAAVESQAFKQYIRGLRDQRILPEAKKTKKTRTDKQLSRLTNIAFGGK